MTMDGFPPAEVEASFTPTRDGNDRRRHVDRRSLLSQGLVRRPERRRDDRRLSGERRLVLLKHQTEDSQRAYERLGRSVNEGAWSTVLHAAHALVRFLPSVPVEARRRVGIRLRRALPRKAIEGIVGIAIRDTFEAPRAAEVLRWIGLDAAEVMVHSVMETEGIGARRVLYDILGHMPEAYPLVFAYLRDGNTHQVTHAAELLGRLGNPDAIELLKQRVSSPEARVRAAALSALAEFPAQDTVETLRSALASPSADTRTSAAFAIGRTRSGAFAMPLAASLENEHNSGASRAAIHALGALSTADAVSALLRVALTRRSFLSRGGFPTDQRVEAVKALGISSAPGERQALERIAREGDEAVARVAGQMMGQRKVVG